ncbi:phage holin family protein [Undibacterium sp.]|uniref:phage holin family protein n=1 Tax=Undibacterium sp. TaxID=1914977 RepID=UPI00374D5C76
MFETIDKARQLGMLGLERIGDYLELLRIEMEMQARDVGERLLSFAVMVFFALLAFFFLGIAILVTCWETEHRIIAAWAVFAAYAVAALVCYLAARKRKPADPALKMLREELQQDIQLLKDLL